MSSPYHKQPTRKEHKSEQITVRERPSVAAQFEAKANKLGMSSAQLLSVLMNAYNGNEASIWQIIVSDDRESASSETKRNTPD